ncbi:ubiquitin-protein ligase [Lithospermum erythrorhizon]|uniref:E2 ubiquitin-conjugating enzyme n=1 Tax=Lithospermum erythrorhizon TaxID=34254 RepID=A0AAV3QIY2_LITER
MEVESGSTESEAPVAENLIYDQGTLIKDHVDSPSLGASASVSLNSDNPNTSNSDLSYHDEEKDGEDVIENDGDFFDYADDDDDDDVYMYDDDDNNDDVDVNDSDDYMSIMQAKFDNADLPPGVEASVSWLKEPTPSPKWAVSLAAPAHSNPTGHLASPGASTALPVVPSIQNTEGIASSSSSASISLNSNRQKIEESLDDITRNYILFKHFDVIDSFSDHHYANMGFRGQQPPKAWGRRIHDDWKILENGLPDTIYARVCEARMDLMRAVIVGPQGTPYHDGLFVFDIFFPTNYPDGPPMVYYYSGGLRLNPNLYDCGKVCLSLLNTWTGHGNENWMPKTSTMLQVLVSIQALILNTKPFFNEPGYDRSYRGVEGEKKSNSYNESVFILSLKTMIYTLRRPPQHFEELVLGHFRVHAHDILSACKAYMEGASVGTVVKGKVQDGALVNEGTSATFKASVGGMMNGLISNFTKKGAVDCEKFRVSGGQSAVVPSNNVQQV